MRDLQPRRRRDTGTVLLLLGSLLLGSGCATLEGDEYGVYDNFEGFNRWSYEFTDDVDRAVLAPVARGYQQVVPNFVERGITNVFANFYTPLSSVNGFLQGKPASGATDLGRFLVNSTIGLAGWFDPATSMDLRAQGEDFGQTLATWGWTRSRYVFLPFMGPTTVRDIPSRVVRSMFPRLVFGSDYHWGYGVVDVVQTRANLLVTSDIRDASSLDPYSFTRDAFLQRRKFVVYDGQPPLEDLFDEFDEFGSEFEDEP